MVSNILSECRDLCSPETAQTPLLSAYTLFILIELALGRLVGGWWVCHKMEEITGNICIEIGPQSYVSALDNGLFTVGALRDEGLSCNYILYTIIQ